MKAVSLARLAQICQGKLHGAGNYAVNKVILDSRRASTDSLFVALKGAHQDGHDFVKDLEGRIAAALVNRVMDADVAQIVVTDTEQALVRLAQFARSVFTGKVIGITGSSGKTSCKNLLAKVLQQAGTVYASQGNQNNELGVPLTLINASGDEDYLVVEMGAAKLGDIAYLMAMTNPDISIITNIAEAHLGRFGSLENIVKAKSEIYCLAETAKAVVNIDEPYADDWLKQLQGRDVTCFSMTNTKADVFASKLNVQGNGSAFNLHLGDQSLPCQLAVAGRHQVANALAAAAIAWALAVPPEAIVAGLKLYQDASGRGCQLTSIWGSKVIDDCYNANPASVKAAIDRLLLEADDACLILGDMAELGEQSQALHKSVGVYAKAQGLTQLWTVGKDSQYASDACSGEHFSSMDAIVARLLVEKPEMPLLIKGSRSAGLEYVVEKLTTKENH